MLDGRKVSVHCAALKPDGDDVRDSPALEVGACLAKMGAHVRVTNPVAVEGARRKYPELEYTASFVEACRDADICVLATESKDYVAADPEVLGAVVARKRMLDCRNVLDRAKWSEAGWTVEFLGRGSDG
jgi:UDPglucose 6-dehydrogenase